MRKGRIQRLILWLTLLLLVGCQSTVSTPDVNNDQTIVSVSILPEAYFLERIAGDLVLVNVMVGPGDDPHSYEPTPNQMRLLANTDIYFSIGVEFEHVWLPRFQNANPNLLVTDVSSGVERIPMSTSHEGDHEGEDDPHIWLSPSRVKIIAKNIANALITYDPTHQEVYQRNLDALLTDINLADDHIHSLLDNTPKRQFLAYHPAWGYFAEDYELEMIAIEIGGQEPGAESLAQVIKLMDQDDLNTIFMQKESSSKSSQAIADEVGAELVILDPLAKDWFTNIQEIAEKIASSLD